MSPSPVAAPGSPWVDRSQALRRFGIVAVLVALDLWSKWAAFRFLTADSTVLIRDQHGPPGHPRFHLWGDWLTFMKSENAGAAFGQLRDFPQALVIGRCVAVVFLIALLLRSASKQRTLVIALVLILSGALGNLHDNLFLESPGEPFGMVRDFIDVYFSVWDWHFPTFNVADSCITVGAVFLILSCFGEVPDPKSPGPGAPDRE